MKRTAPADSMLRRTLGTVELRAADEGRPPRIAGYAAVFNVMSEDVGGYREVIAPGAFTKTLKEADVRALVNHDPAYVLGRNKAGTLRLEEDARGLKFEVDVPETTWAADLTATMQRGDVNQCSFGFRSIRDKWETQEGTGLMVRTQLEVGLFDVSVVTYPAYPQTAASVRALIGSEYGGDPDVAFVFNLIYHHGAMMADAATAPARLNRPEALAMADEIFSRAGQEVQRARALLSAWADAGNETAARALEATESLGTPEPSTPPQPGHLLDLKRRELDLLVLA